MPGSIRVLPDDRSEAEIRRSLWIWWTVSIALIDWLTWSSLEPPERFSITTAILVSIGGIGAGWLFGYKGGIGPLFSSIYVFNSKSE